MPPSLGAAPGTGGGRACAAAPGAARGRQLQVCALLPRLSALPAPLKRSGDAGGGGHGAALLATAPTPSRGWSPQLGGRAACLMELREQRVSLPSTQSLDNISPLVLSVTCSVALSAK